MATNRVFEAARSRFRRGDKYLAGWGEDGALDAVTEAAELIDQIARRIDDELADYFDGPRSAEVAAA